MSSTPNSNAGELCELLKSGCIYLHRTTNPTFENDTKSNKRKRNY